MHLKRHHYLLKRCISCALADAVYSAFNLFGAGAHRFKRIADREAQIIVAMDAYNRLVYIRDRIFYRLYKGSEFLRHRISYGIGYIDNPRARIYYRLNNLQQKIHLCP